MKDNRALVELPRASMLADTKQFHLSLSDVDRMSKFYEVLKKKWSRELLAHAKAGQEGFGIPSKTTDLLKLISEFAPLQELDYVSMSIPGEFLVEFDFSKRWVFLKSRTQETLRQIESAWNQVRRNVTSDESMREDDVVLSARRFILSSFDKTGNLMETDGTPVDLGKAYYLVGLKELGLQTLLEKFATRLLTIQNKDGGWARQGETNSDILATANSLLILNSVSKEDAKDAAARAQGFILSKRRKDGSWKVNWLKIAGTALCVIALKGSGAHSQTLRKSTQLVKNEIPEEMKRTSYDLELIAILKQAGYLREAQLDSEPPKYTDTENTKDDDAIGIATTLWLSKLRSKSGGLREAASYKLLSISNPGGGWPMKRGGESQLFPTVISLLALKER